MAIEVSCTACGKQLRAPDAQAGRSGRCPSCKSPIVIPVLPQASSAAPGSAAAPRREASAHFAASPVQPTAQRDFSPLASTMDEDLGLPLATNPDLANASVSSSDSNSALVEPKHWFALQVSLKITELALLIEWIACAIISLAVIGMLLMTTNRSAVTDVSAIQIMSVLMLWGGVGMVVGWVALATGWVASLKGWPRDKKLLMGSITAAGVAIFSILIVISLQMLGVFSASIASRGAVPFPGAKAIMILWSLASATSLVLYGYYLSNIQKLLGREQITRQPIIYAAVVATLTVFCLILNLAVTPSSTFMIWFQTLTNIVTLVGQFLWLWLINAFASRDLRVNHAWKRL